MKRIVVSEKQMRCHPGFKREYDRLVKAAREAIDRYERLGLVGTALDAAVRADLDASSDRRTIRRLALEASRE